MSNQRKEAEIGFIWVLTEDRNSEPGTAEAAKNFWADVQTTQGYRVGDAETQPSASALRDSPLRTGVGYAVVVRTSDMKVIGNFNEFQKGELYAAIDETLAGPVPAHDGDFDFSRCEGGPFREFESCNCDDNCVGDLLCAPGTGGTKVCTPPCSSADVTCPENASCVLAAKSGDLAAGLCLLKAVGEGTPAAASCSVDSDCEVGLCDAVTIVGRTICRVSCEVASDCGDGYACSEGTCTAANTGGASCQGPAEEEGGCSSVGATAAAPFWLLGVLFMLRRRRC